MQLYRSWALIAVAMMVVGGCRGSASSAPELRLASAASEIARFLTSHARFDDLLLADSVDLYLAPEGGGAHARVAREQLRDPEAWRVGSGTSARSFVPKGLRTRVVTDVGHYMNCQPSAMSTRFPKLATLPHVGVRLEPPRVRSCPETWNATFVFDTTSGRPRLVAAVYDQFVW